MSTDRPGPPDSGPSPDGPDSTDEPTDEPTPPGGTTSGDAGSEDAATSGGEPGPGRRDPIPPGRDGPGGDQVRGDRGGGDPEGARVGPGPDETGPVPPDQPFGPDQGEPEQDEGAASAGNPPPDGEPGPGASGEPRPGGTPGIDPRIHQRRLAIARLEGRRRLRIVIGAAGVVVLVLVAWALLHTGLFGARVVTVTGSHPHTTTAAIVVAANLGGRPPLIDVDPAATAARVESLLPYIASATVRRHWPDGVSIAVTERTPVAAMAGPGPSWSVLDGSGRTLQVVAAQPPGVPALVVHTAAGTLRPAPVGGTLPPSAGPALTVCRTLPPAFSAQVVSVTSAPDATIELALNSGLTVRFGTDSDRNAKYEDVAAILAQRSLPRAAVIDVSVPQSPTIGS